VYYLWGTPSYWVSVLSYGITQCFLPPNTIEHTPPNLRPIFDLPIPEGWKAELT